MNADMADSSNMVKQLLIKAEDARILGDMKAMRKYYRQLYDLNRCGLHIGRGSDVAIDLVIIALLTALPSLSEDPHWFLYKSLIRLLRTLAPCPFTGTWSTSTTSGPRTMRSCSET